MDYSIPHSSIFIRLIPEVLVLSKMADSFPLKCLSSQMQSDAINRIIIGFIRFNQRGISILLTVHALGLMI